MSNNTLSNEACITKYRAAIARFATRRQTGPTGTTDYMQIYDICIATLNSKIAHLQTLVPKAPKVTDVPDDAEYCSRLNDLQSLSEDCVAKELPRLGTFGAVMSGEAVVPIFRGMSVI